MTDDLSPFQGKTDSKQRSSHQRSCGGQVPQLLPTVGGYMFMIAAAVSMNGLISVQCWQPGPAPQAHVPRLMCPRAGAKANSFVKTKMHHDQRPHHLACSQKCWASLKSR